MRILLKADLQMLKLEAQHGVFPVDCKKTDGIIQAEGNLLNTQVEPLFSGLEDCLIKWHHVLNVNRNIRPRLLVQAMFINQVPHSLHTSVSLNACIDGTSRHWRQGN